MTSDTAIRARIDQPANARATRLAPPKPSSLLRSDVGAVIAAVSTVTVGMWMQGGGLSSLAEGSTAALLSLGRLTGLFAALFALLGLVLAARPAQLERKYGLDRMLGWHRVVGISTVLLVTLHAVLDTIGWVSGAPRGSLNAFVDMLGQPWMISAVAGATLFIAVGLTSWRRIRQRMSYESWYFIHLSGYLAVLLAFGHQVFMGTDIAGATVATIWWVFLFAAAATYVAYSRLAVIARSVFRRKLMIAAVEPVAPGVGALHITGPGLRRMRARPGQFFMLRVLAPGLWWQSHPFSLSSAPHSGGLRFTVKELGDGTAGILTVAPGTRVLLEGPYGTFNADRAQGEPVAIFGAGVGMGPLLSLLHDVTPQQRPVVFVRARTEEEVLHREELEALVAQRGGQVHLLIGPRAWFAKNDTLDPELLASYAPDLARRHAFICGPASFEHSIVKSLRKLGASAKNIHLERFGI